ncbi:hypothetical protein IJL65_02820 [bacterium]|nr:hypothetical protein [bacterium]
MSYFVNQFLYIRYKALSNSSHVNNSALTFSPSTRHVFAVVQVSTVAPVDASAPVHATDQEFISLHVHTTLHVEISVPVQIVAQVLTVVHVHSLDHVVV